MKGKVRYADWGPEVEQSVSSSRRENRAFIARLVTGRPSVWKELVKNRKCQMEPAQQVGETGQGKIVNLMLGGVLTEIRNFFTEP